jgi:hypothetical protein
MPNEKINDTVSDGWYTEVRWRAKPTTPPDDGGSAEGHVQIATVNVHSPFEFPDVEHEGTWEAGDKFDGWRVTLDASGIDRLIKALHKAKHQAFGEERLADSLVPGSGVTVESDATAAARLDTEGYRRAREGRR